MAGGNMDGLCVNGQRCEHGCDRPSACRRLASVHEVSELKAAVAHTLECRVAGCEWCLRLREAVD